jgi:hypothetical protein
MSAQNRNRSARNAPRGVDGAKLDRLHKWMVFGLGTLVMFALATSAHARTQMYTGEMVFDAFGNDTSTGSVYPQSYAFDGQYPWGPVKCNTRDFHAQSTLTWMTAMGTVLNTWSLSIPEYGGQIPTYNLGTSMTGTMASMTRVTGDPANCYGSGSVPLSAPLVGGGAVPGQGGLNTVDPRPITLSASDLVRVTSGGSFANANVYRFGIEYADLKNGAGTFFEGGGGGDFNVLFQQGQQNEGNVIGKAGDNQFGGVMRLLGTYHDREGYYKINHIVVADYNWLFEAVGASGNVDGSGMIIGGSLTSSINVGTATNDGAKSTTTVQQSAFPWTTGTVTVTATRGPLTSIQARAGYDNRTKWGGGTIQLVSPMLTRWIYTGGQYETLAMGVMKLNFVPEAGSMLMLGAGVSLLGMLYHTNRKR